MNDSTVAVLDPAPSPSVSASAALLTQAYATLKRVARRRRRVGRPCETLSTTALVHEAFIRVAAGGHLEVDGEVHLIALCARTMRHVVVDYARARAALKRGAGRGADAIDVEAPDHSDPVAMLAMDEALARIERTDPRLARVIELRVFAGLDPPAIAELLHIDPRTVQREWLRARLWLSDALP